MAMLKRLLREPLLHFLLIGAAIFGVYRHLGGEAEPDGQDILVTRAQIERIAAAFEAAWKRPPSSDELQALVDEYVREEVYYREALALGLDQGDAVIRRRLRQKMEFLVDTTAQLLEPTDEELRAFYAQHLDDYRMPPRLSFEQLYLGEAPLPGRAEAVLAALRTQGPDGGGHLGERTLLPPAMNRALPNAVDGVFGAGFFERVSALPAGAWAGPVRSAYGLHLVRVQARQAGEVTPFVEVRNQVLREWRMAQARALRDRDYAERRARYRIRVEGRTGSGDG